MIYICGEIAFVLSLVYDFQVKGSDDATVLIMTYISCFIFGL